MLFSKACEYGIRATIYIAHQSKIEARASLKDIAKEIASPEAYTAKILQLLVKGNIINSTKGAWGGFSIDAKKCKKIKLQDIAFAIDGEKSYSTCVLGLKQCSEVHPCPVHEQFKGIKKELIWMLKSTDLHSMMNSIEEGSSCLKI